MELRTFHTEDSAPAGTVFITHGYAEHQGRYAHVRDHLLHAGYDVVLWDLPGHGTSAGPRARVDVGKLITLHRQMRRVVLSEARPARGTGGSSDTEAPRLFLLGHSMGGLITAASALIDARDLAGVVLTGPALELTSPVTPDMARALSRTAEIVPFLPVGTTGRRPEDSLLSRDPMVQLDYDADPLNHHGTIPILTAVTMLIQGDEVLKRAAHFTAPLLVFHGSRDELTSPWGSQTLVDDATAAGNTDAHLRLIDGARHEVLNEPESDMILSDIVLWLDAHTVA